ncbi:hypothetical protein EZS27_016071 [termite gut metagenome]|uniref:Uncharacterized protein n=1 Tax=termite gut metagenome TaxID=433724 RepID=A0A5J4RRW7_9ZZZZ
MKLNENGEISNNKRQNLITKYSPVELRVGAGFARPIEPGVSKGGRTPPLRQNIFGYMFNNPANEKDNKFYYEGCCWQYQLNLPPIFCD